MGKNIIKLQKLDEYGYKTILQFRITESGKGEFFGANSEFGKNYASLLKATGLQINGKNIVNPITQPEKFIQLAPRYDSSSYLRWI